MDKHRWVAAMVVGMALAAGGAVAQGAPGRDAQGRLIAADGFALYVYDADTPAGQSRCSGPCAAIWPPYAVSAGATPPAGFAVVTRADGSHQWAWHGRPLYRYAGDEKAGQPRGDGTNGRWHLAH